MVIHGHYPSQIWDLRQIYTRFKALYHNPHTRIKLPACYSEYFPLGSSTRQGCALSPLIFALAIEPLARAINNPNIKGYQKVEEEFKLSMYADNVLVFLSDPVVSLLNLVSLLREFHVVSGLGVNLTKFCPTNKCTP